MSKKIEKLKQQIKDLQVELELENDKMSCRCRKKEYMVSGNYIEFLGERYAIDEYNGYVVKLWFNYKEQKYTGRTIGVQFKYCPFCGREFED